MAMTRRKTLGLIGGGVLVTSVTGLGGFLATREPKRALSPWRTAGNYDDPRLFALSYAVLAPNPHNRQPWLVDIATSNDEITVYRDAARDLPETDPFARQLTIGLGCFLELMNIAASKVGRQIDFDLYPQGESGPVAVARFRQGAALDPLFNHVLDRRSCKEPFTQSAIPERHHSALRAFGELIVEPDRVAAIKQLTLDAYNTEMYTPRTAKESVDLMRLGKTQINNNPDGIDLGGGLLDLLVVTGILNKQALSDPNSTIFQDSVRQAQNMLQATPAYMALTTPTNTRVDQINAGRRWLRLNLTTTALGLALHPVSQALQEYEEMQPYYEKVHQLLAQPGHRVQMLGRLGFGPTVAPTPRWAIETRIHMG